MKRFTSFVSALRAIATPLALAASVGGIASGLVLGATLGGCSSSTSDACSAYVPPAGTDLTTAVSFKTDVVPIFVNSCAFTSCHGSQTSTNEGVYLGSKDATLLDTGRIYTAVVGVSASELPAMSYVAAGDTANSYLMHKIDGDLCAISAKCTGASCQSTMPQGGDLLEASTRDVIRRWILQGAKNN